MTVNKTNFPFIKALKRQPVEYTPIWIMRQAGRYLPEYRKIRANVKNFLALCKTPELACEVTLQPIRRFRLDAAIIFSDILTIPDAMGLGLQFKENEGPCFDHPIRTQKAISALRIPDVDQELNYVMQAIRLVRQELEGRLPVIGFSGSPWTLATYMVEGGPSKNFSIIKKLMYTEPDAFGLLLEKLVAAISAYLNAQVEAGADALMIFDTWGGILTPSAYQSCSLTPMSRIIENIKNNHPDVPIILFTKNGGLWLQQIIDSGADAIGLDWTMDIGVAQDLVKDKVALQGNMDPSILYSSSDQIRKEVHKILTSYGQPTGHIFNLGHGIYPDVPVENVEILVDSVHDISQTLYR